MYNNYTGKNIYQCYAMGGRINFQSHNISLCHSLEGEDPVIEFKYGIDNLAEVYLNGLKKILDDVQLEKVCKECSMRKIQQFIYPKIRVITLNVNTQCNSKCLYCCSHSVNRNKSVSIVPHIIQLEQADLMDRDCFFDFGGGEPTLDPFFEENLSYISDQNYVIRVNTNALGFSEILATFAQNDKDINIRISVDAGTEATFLRIKGINNYDSVWQNIQKYREHTPNIAIKYVLCKYNTSIEDLEGFVEACVRTGINKIYVDIDHDAYSEKMMNGWSEYTQDMFDAAYKLTELAEKNCIEALIGYVWTAGDKVQETYDYNQVMRDSEGERYISSGGKIQLPESYKPHNREEVNLTYNKYNNLSELIQILRKKKVILYGAGDYGNRLLREIEGHVEIVGVIDSNPNLEGSNWNGLTVMRPECLARMQDVNLLISSSYGDEIMALLNQKKLLNLKDHIYYMTRGDFDYYE